MAQGPGWVAAPGSCRGQGLVPTSAGAATPAKAAGVEDRLALGAGRSCVRSRWAPARAGAAGVEAAPIVTAPCQRCPAGSRSVEAGAVGLRPCHTRVRGGTRVPGWGGEAAEMGEAVSCTAEGPWAAGLPGREGALRPTRQTQAACHQQNRAEAVLSQTSWSAGWLQARALSQARRDPEASETLHSPWVCLVMP